MTKVNLIIVEDDHYNVRAVKTIVESHFPEIKILSTAARVQDAIEKIEAQKPDLILMDIHLIDGTAFDILKKCQYKDYKIVFMSAYHEYAVKAMQYSAVDFVFKPFDINELVVAIDKAIEQLNDTNYQLKIDTLFNNIDKKENTIILQGQETIKPYSVNEIVWAKAIQGGANFYLTDGSCFVVTKPLRRYESILSDFSFFRCHTHHLINLHHVKEIKANQHIIKLSNNYEVACEARRYEQLRTMLQDNNSIAKTILNKLLVKNKQPFL